MTRTHWVTILALGFGIGASAIAEPLAPPGACPDLSSLQADSAPRGEKSPAQITADALVAEAKGLMRPMSGERLARAISLTEQALGEDPQNAAAWFLLAGAHRHSQRYLSVNRPLAHARAWEALSKGRALAPGNVDGLYLLADQAFLATNDHRCARHIFDTALRLYPDNALIHFWMSQLLSGFGEFDLAWTHADRALALADASTRDMLLQNSGRPRYFAGQYDWVLQHYAAYLKAKPDFWLAHFYRSLAFGAKGQFSEALEEARRAMPDAPKGDAGGIGMLALAYARAGQEAEARALLQELRDRDARGEHVVEYRIAVVYAALGESDLALQWLDRAIDDRDGLFVWTLWLMHDPAWVAMRHDPRFAAVRKRAGW